MYVKYQTTRKDLFDLIEANVVKLNFLRNNLRKFVYCFSSLCCLLGQSEIILDNSIRNDRHVSDGFSNLRSGVMVVRQLIALGWVISVLLPDVTLALSAIILVQSGGAKISH